MPVRPPSYQPLVERRWTPRRIDCRADAPENAAQHPLPWERDLSNRPRLSLSCMIGVLRWLMTFAAVAFLALGTTGSGASAVKAARYDELRQPFHLTVHQIEKRLHQRIGDGPVWGIDSDGPAPCVLPRDPGSLFALRATGIRPQGLAMTDPPVSRAPPIRAPPAGLRLT